MTLEKRLNAKTRVYKTYWRTSRKTHMFDPKMAPKCRKMAPRSFQEPSWPFLLALGPLLELLSAILGRLGRSWGPLRANLKRSWPSWRALGVSWCDLWALLERLAAILKRPRRELPPGGLPQGGLPRYFLRRYIHSRILKTEMILRDVHVGLQHASRASPGAADRNGLRPHAAGTCRRDSGPQTAG